MIPPLTQPEQPARPVAPGWRPVWLPLGGVLLVLAWVIAWFGPAPWSEYTFFPLWLGYILLVDGLTVRRTGASLLASDPRRFALLFVASVPLWWLFELANRWLGNWEYILPRSYSPLRYNVLASIAFSTVVPALFVTATFLRSFRWFATPRRWWRLAPGRRGLVLLILLGAAMIIATMLWPGVAFPLIWIGLFLVFDPINRLLGNVSLAEEVATGRWDTVLTLFAASLICGFCWELWNWGSMPKWVYHIPFANRPTLFEMPVLGYGGYLPFALEVYAAYQLMVWLVRRRRESWLTFNRPVPVTGGAAPGRAR